MGAPRLVLIPVHGAREYAKLTDCPICNAETYYQPEDSIAADRMSFEVWSDRATCEADNPGHALITLHGDDVEGPSFMDCPYRHEGEIDEPAPAGGGR